MLTFRFMYIPAKGNGNATDLVMCYYDKCHDLKNNTREWWQFPGWKCKNTKLQQKSRDAKKP